MEVVSKYQSILAWDSIEMLKELKRVKKEETVTKL